MANINTQSQNPTVDPMDKAIAEAKAKVQPILTVEQELEALRRENALLKAGSKSHGRVTARLSAKGGMSVYGLGRFPVTLYKSQWEAFFGVIDTIRAFFEANKATMKDKP